MVGVGIQDAQDLFQAENSAINCRVQTGRRVCVRLMNSNLGPFPPPSRDPHTLYFDLDGAPLRLPPFPLSLSSTRGKGPIQNKVATAATAAPLERGSLTTRQEYEDRGEDGT